MNSSSNATNDSSTEDLPEVTVSGLVSFFVITLFVLPLGIAGNTLVIVVVKKKRYLHTKTNFLLANLAASDLMANLLGYPTTAIRVFPLEASAIGVAICRINSFYPAASLCSILTLTVIAIERYKAVVKPMSSGLKFDKRTLRVFIASIWTVSLLAVIPLVYFDEYTAYQCRRSWSKSTQIVFWTVTTILCICLPLLVIIYCYVRIIRTLYFGRKVVPMNIPIEVDAREKRKVIKLSIIVTAVFILSFLPFVVVRQLEVRFQVSYTTRTLSLIAILLSSLLNPFIYAFQSSNYRKAFKETMAWSTKNERYSMFSIWFSKNVLYFSQYHSGRGGES